MIPHTRYYSLFRCPYSNSVVGIRQRPVYVRVADAPAAQPGTRRNYSSTEAGYSCNVKHTYTYHQPRALV